MSKATPPSDVLFEEEAPAVPVPRGIQLAPLSALFWLTVRQLARSGRLTSFVLLFCVPLLAAVAYHVFRWRGTTSQMESAMILKGIANGIAPLMALTYASGMIQNEIEEQTLTYLLVRPLPRWAIYLTKLLATAFIAIVTVSAFTTLTYAAVYWGTDGFWPQIVPDRAFKNACLFSLAVVSYCSLFGCLSVFTRRSLVVGVIYIALVEGLLANVDFALRRLTVMYYIRVLRARWLDLGAADTGLNLGDAPQSGACVLILVAVSVLATGLATVAFAQREFRVKTPGAS